MDNVSKSHTSGKLNPTDATPAKASVWERRRQLEHKKRLASIRAITAASRKYWDDQGAPPAKGSK